MTSRLSQTTFLKQLARLPTRSEVSWIALRLALDAFAGIGGTYVLRARVGTLPTLVRAAPIAVRPPSSVGTLPSAVRTPSAIIVVRCAVRRNPSTPPPAPMARYRMPTPTAAAPHLDDGSRWRELLHARPRRRCISCDRG